MASTLSIKNLNKSFGKQKVLTDISFECEKGHIIGLIGANGAGKTTIMKSILCLIKSEGQVTIDGQNSTFNNHSILSEVGALIEYPGIYPFLTGRDHLKLFVHNTKQKTERVQGIITDLKMTNYIDQRAKNYSLGMKQKLGIAMALINDPKLVILDEPMNGLDPQATKDLRDLILKRKAMGTTFLISSHILGELQKLAEDLVVIEQGKVIKLTTMQELLDSNQHIVVLTTNDDQKAISILKESGYQVVKTDQVKVQMRTEDKLDELMKLLLDQQINLQDVQHEDADLEDSVLNILAK